VLQLLRETVRLTAQIADLELRESAGERSAAPAEVTSTDRPSNKGARTPEAHRDLLRRARELEIEILDLQADAAAAMKQNGDLDPASEPFGPAEYLHYRRLVGKLRGIARAELPTDATVVVISKGDDELLDLGVRQAWHFPQDEHGGYAGHHPDSSETAIAQLEELRRRGAGYLLVPATASWWLDRYPEFGQHLKRNHALVFEDSEVCSIFSLETT
jgi:hypothetical protein